jgi:hypothetical protein
MFFLSFFFLLYVIRANSITKAFTSSSALLCHHYCHPRSFSFYYYNCYNYHHHPNDSPASAAATYPCYTCKPSLRPTALSQLSH